MKGIFSVLVENKAGVLSKTAGLFARRGFNIDSLAVGETDDRDISSMTIISTGDERIMEQIEKQLAKLEDVIDIKKLQDGESVCRELILVKIKINDTQRQAVLSVANIFRAKIVDVSNDSMVIELTGGQSKLDAFLDLLRGYDILELARTGITGLSRGSSNVTIID